MTASYRAASFDVGTNTVLTLVADVASETGVRRVAEFARITRLGRGVDATQRLDPDSARLTLEAIAEFADRARALGATRFVGAATAALRDAADGREFIARVAQRAGVELKIISGPAEAELSHLAVIRGLTLDPRRSLLIVDIGGGSTEFIDARPGVPLRVKSLQIGSVRLTERIIRGDPPDAVELERLRATIDAALAELGWEMRPEDLVGIAGTVTTVCAVSMGLESYFPDRVHGHRMSRAEVRGALELFSRLTTAERRQIPSMLEGRADVILAGTMILDRVMEACAAESVVVSDQGVRWGLLWRELERARLRTP